MPSHSALFNGYDRYKSFRGTTTGGAVTTIDLGFATSAVLIYPPASGSFYVTLGGSSTAAGTTDPTADGTTDADDEMIEVASGDGPLSADISARVVKLIHASAVDYRVIALG